ncbi:MAG: hypothetical protein ACK4V2_01105 [Pseudomonadota bacterium]|jgi:tRNA threonylcarbamoyladenosine modification (KEOPS) complex Cgi121 subunit|nr:hypothetical protein [Alphaproteobacteria bacterium]
MKKVAYWLIGFLISSTFFSLMAGDQKDVDFCRLYMERLTPIQGYVGGKLERLPEMMARNMKNISAMEVGINGRRNITSDFKPLFSRGSSKINQEKARALFTAFEAREIQMYQHLFAQADSVIHYQNSRPTPDATANQQAQFLTCFGYSVPIFPEESPEDVHRVFALALSIQSEAQNLKVLNNFLIDRFNWDNHSLAAYFTNQGGAGGRVKQEALDVLAAYGLNHDPIAAECTFLEASVPSDYTKYYDFCPKYELMDVEINAMPRGKEYKKVREQITKQDVLAAARSRGDARRATLLPPAAASEYDQPLPSIIATSAVTAAVTAAVADENEVAVVLPVLVSAFTLAENEFLTGINVAMETIQVGQQAAYSSEQRFGGFSERERIMAYGSEVNDFIGIAKRNAIDAMLKGQLRKRGIVVPDIRHIAKETKRGYDAAKVYLNDWIREKSQELFFDVSRVIGGMSYTVGKAIRAVQADYHTDLLNTFWMLPAMSERYDVTQNQAQKDQIASLLVLSFNMMHEHEEACGIGARGRNLLMQMAMLNFFKDFDPHL